MRNNLPITQRENNFPASELLMSATDLKGVITYVNPAFARVCKYLPSEMIGQPHNLIRHPDVPEEAYHDLWHNLSRGRFWTGILKNRCKDGDFYWVRANVTPVLRDGELVGFVSVRVKPSEAEVHEASRIYAAFQKGGSGLQFRNGRVVHAKSHPRGWLERLQTLPVRAQIWSTLGTTVAAWAIVAWFTRTHAEWAGAVWPVAACAALAGFFIHRGVMARMGTVMEDATLAANGGTPQSRRLRSGDQVSVMQQAILQSSLNMHTFVADADRMVESLNRTTAEISEGAQQLAAAAESASAQIDETTQAMREFAGTVADTARDAQQAQQLARKAGDNTHKVAELARDTSMQIDKVNAANKKIDGIVEVIDGIAFQTNLLALNAAVEAARAGDAGRGFAVVASEVRALASRSATAAKEIASILQEVVGLAQASSRQAGDTARAMDDILDENGKLTQVVANIAAASTQQATRVQDVQASLVALDQLTANNASSAQHFEGAVQNINDQVGALGTAIQIFHQTRASSQTRDAAAASLPPRFQPRAQLAT